MKNNTKNNSRAQAAIESPSATARSPHGQAAMEYLMTYGWALLVIVVVIAILVSLNLFSAPQGCNFERVGFSCGSPVIDTNGLLFLPITNGNPNNIKLIAVSCIADKKPTPPTMPIAGKGYYGTGGGIDGKPISRQSTYDVSADAATQPLCYKADGSTVFTSSAGSEFSGKVWVFYRNEEDGVNYPVRTVSANLVTKTVQANTQAVAPNNPPVDPNNPTVPPVAST